MRIIVIHNGFVTVAICINSSAAYSADVSVHMAKITLRIRSVLRIGEKKKQRAGATWWQVPWSFLKHDNLLPKALR